MTMIANQSHLFRAIRTIGETFKKLTLLGGQFRHLFSAIGFLADFINTAGDSFSHNIPSTG